MESSNYTPSTTYDAKDKIWTGGYPREHYAMDLSIGEIIFEEMRRQPKQVCQVSATELTVLTRAQMLSNAIKVATYLRHSCGIGQHDIVALMGTNTTHMAAVAYACFFNGTAFHAVNPSYGEETIRNLCAITQPKIIFCDGEFYMKIENATKTIKARIYTMKQHIDGVSTILDILNLAVDNEFRPIKLEQGLSQNLAILCSSGTTGSPKAVTLSNARKIFQSFCYLNGTDVQFSTSNLDWISGLITLITAAVYGTKRIVSENVYEPEAYLKIIEKFKVTWTFQVPAHMAMLLACETLQTERLDSVLYYHYGGGRCTLQSQIRLQQKLRYGQLHFVYGFTELGAVMTRNNQFYNKPNAVGCLLPGFKVQLVNDEGQQLGPNKLGEILVQHGQQWRGYFDNELATKQMLDETGWFHSGDLGYFDDDGFLFVVDRKKDMLKYMGVMYYPHEIEDIVAQMPEVAEICVFGIWNQLEGDVAAALVVKKAETVLNAEDVIEYVKQHAGANYKELRGGALIVDELKRTENGKISRIANRLHFLYLQK